MRVCGHIFFSPASVGVARFVKRIGKVVQGLWARAIEPGGCIIQALQLYRHQTIHVYKSMYTLHNCCEDGSY